LPENVPVELARPSAAPAAIAAESRARPGEVRPQPDAPLSISAAGLDRDGKLIATLQELRRVLADADPGPSAVTRFPAIRVGSRIAPRRRLAVIVGAAVLATLAVVGYYANREPPTANLQSSGRVATGAAGAAVSLPASEGVKGPGVSTSSPTPPPAVAADPQPAKGTAADARPPDAQARAPSEPPAPVSSAVTAPSSTEVERGILKHHPPRVACTEGVAALGLCAPQDNQRMN
jgi:hypothetical protein